MSQWNCFRLFRLCNLKIYFIQTKHVYYLLLLLQFAAHLSQGVLAASIDEMKLEFDMSYTEQGLLGGIIHLTIGFSTPLSYYCLTKTRRFTHKSMLISIILSLIFTLFLASVPNHYSKLLITARGLQGLSESMYIVYFPIWISKFAPSGKQGEWTATINSAAPLGIMLGYLSCILFSFDAPCKLMECWRYTVLIQVCILTLCAAIWFVIPDHLVSLFEEEELDQDKPVTAEDDFVTYITSTDLDVFDHTYNHNHNYEGNRYINNDHDHDDDIELITTTPDTPDIPDIINSNLDMNPSKNLNLKKKLILLAQNRVYINTIICITCIWYIVTILQLWGTTFIQSLTTVDDTQTPWILFVVICTTSPVLGLMIGGKYSKKLGGFSDIDGQTRNAIFSVCCSFFAQACVFLFVLYTRNIFVAAMWIWLIIFSGACTVPVYISLMIKCLPTEVQSLGNSISTFIFNVFGYFASPIVAGYLMDLTSSVLIGFQSSLLIIVICTWSSMYIVYMYRNRI
jgi:MFS family permease